MNIYNSTLGAQGNINLGSAYATDSGKVYMAADAKKWQTRVDFFYFFDSQSGNSHSIAAPNDGVLAAEAPGLINGWIVKNATKFKVVSMTEAEFDAIKSSAEINQKYSLSSAPEKSIAPTLGDGTVLQKSFILFKTVKNKSGAIKINSITETAVQKESSMSITVKVQR